MFTAQTKSCEKIPIQEIRFFSNLIKDYLNKSEKTAFFYNNFPDLEGVKKQIQCKEQSVVNRTVLVSSLQNQYAATQTSKRTQQNILALANSNTFTVTTGHQLNLFTGPLYFLYKIISAINLSEQLTNEFPEHHFVPVYWMATEDHDFDEINFFNFKGKKIQWNSHQKGAVGRFSTDGLEQVFDVFTKQLNLSANAQELKRLFKEAYLNHQNLAEATRFLVNELFGSYGLVIIDADCKLLKQQFIPYAKQDLLHHTAFTEVSNTSGILKNLNYKVQVNPREINLFYLKDGLRERIIFNNENYHINNTNISFSQENILNELNQFPERFSPNVILRPLYQEVILPNLCYIGGGGELAYWFELQHYFESQKVVFPILLLRNSVQLISEKQLIKLKKLTISKEELFFEQQELIAKKTLENSTVAVNFETQRATLQDQFLKLKTLALKTDKSFIGAVNAQEKKQLKGLYNLEKKWLKAEKRNQQEFLTRIVTIQNELLPSQSLEERQRNFAEFYQEFGENMIDTLKQNLNPLEFYFNIIKL